MVPERTVTSVEHLSGYYYNHIYEVGDEFPMVKYEVKTERVEIRFIKDFCFDGRRVWQLATVWLDSKPVMIVQNAGREGDDYSARFITDATLFREMCQHIKELLPVDQNYIEEICSNTKTEGLIEFYGNHLDDNFEHY
jgi:hypothetical protein